jgi:branched-subunit amino acid ABC-type transport system permease component
LLDLSWSFYVEQFIAGLSLAMFLFLIASGLSLILGVMGIVNFAHGSFYMIAAYLVWYLAVSSGANFWVAVIAAAACLAVIGFLMQKFLISRLYGQPELQLLLTFAFVLIFSDLIKMGFGVLPKGVSYPALLSGVLEMGAVSFPKYHIFVIIIGPIVAYLLNLVERRTRIGRIVRAASLNRDMVAALGINTERIFTIIFAFGAFLAGLGGALAAPTSSIAPGMDVPVVLPAFVAVVVGGLGSFGGTFLACLLIGEVKVFGILLLPRLAESFIFIIMAIILIIRPWGLSNRPPKWA